MNTEDKRFAKAVGFAAKKHCGAVRKGTDANGAAGVPYIVHPMEVAAIVATMTEDRDVLCAAVLHDVAEDAGVTREELTKKFNERVAELVCAESEDKREGLSKDATWHIRKQETLEHLKEAEEDVKIICLGDKLSNLRAMYRDFRDCGEALWERFNQKDPRAHKWYYTGVAKQLTSLSMHQAYREYLELLEKVFGRYEDLTERMGE